MEKEENIALKLKDIRIKNNLSQRRFGNRIGKSGKTISAYESGRCVPTLKVLDTISQVYDVTFLHLKRSKKDQMREKLKNLKDTIRDIEKTFLSDINELED